MPEAADDLINSSIEYEGYNDYYNNKKYNSRDYNNFDEEMWNYPGLYEDD